MEYEIRHNLNENRFEALANQEIIGIVNYYEEGNVIIVTHTGVKTNYEGQGIAATLTKAILMYTIKNNFKINPLCSYTKNYIDRHPEYNNLLQNDDE